MLLLLTLVLAVPSGGEVGPVTMSAAGGLQVDLKRKVGVAKGDVLIERADVRVCCDEAEAEYEGQEIVRVSCRGRVVIVRPDGTQAVADRAVFDARADRVTLEGKARVKAEAGDLEGDLITYDIKRDQVDVRGTGRSRFRFRPPSPSAPLPRACPPARR